ncbi:MAG: recombinase family protein, partial [Vicinamibacterales bacterium]
RKNARIVSPDAPDDDSPSSVLMRQILDCFSQYERLVIKARTRAAMQAARKRGQVIGRVPWGYRVGEDGRTLVPDLEERKILTEIRRLRGEGLALISIADDFNARGWRNRQGRPWLPNFIGQLLERHPRPDSSVDCAADLT